MTEDKSILITGANRGIGLSLAKLYRNLGWAVIATCRDDANLKQEADIEVIDSIDVSDPGSAARLKSALGERSIDVLINNAGILRNEVLGSIDYTSIQQQMEINALGPLRLTEVLLSNFKEGSKIIMITSRMGSIADNTSGGRYGYRMSKAALNIASVSLAHDLKSRGISVGIIHPGLVGTEMIGGQGDITPDQAAERIAQRVAALTLDNTGSFWHSNGERLPW